MQNRYVADVGHYGKYGLLRTISKANLTLGVNWYLAPDESHNADGKHTAYLNNNSDRYFDNELYNILKGMFYDWIYINAFKSKQRVIKRYFGV